MHSATCRLLATVLLVWLSGPLPSDAQVERMSYPVKVHSERAVNFFIGWSGVESISGYELDLPPSWDLNAAYLTDRSGEDSYPAQVLRGSELRHRYRILFDEIRGPHELIVEVWTGASEGMHEWSIAPLRKSEENEGSLEQVHEWRRGGRVQTEIPRSHDARRALQLDESGSLPVIIPPDRLPLLVANTSYTVEFWMNTIRRNQIVMSAWDGDETTGYPFEIVINSSGRLVCFQGHRGYHSSIATSEPVAHGTWKHIALTYDADSGWTRLFLNGVPSDSIRTISAVSDSPALPVGLGNRVPRQMEVVDNIQRQSTGYAGMLDAVRFWNRARSAAEIRRTMRRSLADAAEGMVSIAFDEESDDGFIEIWPDHARSVPSELQFTQPVENFRAAIDGDMVRLSWMTDDRNTLAFTLERSADGETFERIGSLPVYLTNGAPERYTYNDLPESSDVVFYRIRQMYTDETESISPTLKVGLGSTGDQSVAILGNSPNPFATTTSISYFIPTAQYVRISIWNVSGHIVNVLEDGLRSAGTHEVVFESPTLPSGIYFVRLEGEGQTDAHKIILRR